MLSSEELRLLQLTELDILNTTVKFCEKNNIKYSMESGTMLGAVRHKGFIPWDDDVDICMDVNSYKKFQSLSKNFPNNYLVQTYKLEKEYPLRWMKIRKKGTTSLEEETAKISIHHGISIDVFPVSGLEENKILQLIQMKAFEKYKYLLLKYQCLSHESIDRISGKWKMYYKLPDKIRVLISKFYELLWMKPLKPGGKCFSAFNQKQIFPTSYFLNLDDYKFEELILKGPKEYGSYLSTLYGDWHKFPPMEERYSHKNMMLSFDTEYIVGQGN